MCLVIRLFIFQMKVEQIRRALVYLSRLSFQTCNLNLNLRLWAPQRSPVPGPLPPCTHITVDHYANPSRSHFFSPPRKLERRPSRAAKHLAKRKLPPSICVIGSDMLIGSRVTSRGRARAETTCFKFSRITREKCAIFITC